jgi:hypothetical protein
MGSKLALTEEDSYKFDYKDYVHIISLTLKETHIETAKETKAKGAILPKTVQNNKTLFEGQAGKQYFMPKPVMYHHDRSNLINHLSLTPNGEGKAQFEFALQDIIAEYAGQLIGKKEKLLCQKTLFVRVSSELYHN